MSGQIRKFDTFPPVSRTALSQDAEQMQNTYDWRVHWSNGQYFHLQEIQLLLLSAPEPLYTPTDQDLSLMGTDFLGERLRKQHLPP